MENRVTTASEIFSLKSPIRILDLGAMKFPGETSLYESLLGRYPCEVIGFDALPEECEKLAAFYGDQSGFTFLPQVIGDGSQRTLHICSLKSRSSLFEPNIHLCEKFSAFADYMHVTEKRTITTHRLDDIAEIGDVDWVKMDIQGAELDAVRGGGETLRKSVVIESEVEFVEQYLGQPLFAEVDQAIRKLGFMFHTFLGYGTRPLKPIVRDGDPRKGFRQWLWADAVYIRGLDSFETLEPEKLLKMACILHEAYKSFDFAYHALRNYDLLCGTKIADQYLQIIEL